MSEERPVVHVLGLGPGPIGLVTLETVLLLEEAGEVLLRTERHPCVPELRARGVRFRPLDRHYDKGGSMEEVYAAIAGEVAEEAAGLDLRQLLRVTDQDHLRSRCRCVVEQRREFPCPDHARFIDDERAARSELPFAPVELESETGDGHRLDPGALLELMCCRR